MTALNFPSSPTLNQIYSANGKSYSWNGTSWLALRLEPISSSYAITASFALNAVGGGGSSVSASWASSSISSSVSTVAVSSSFATNALTASFALSAPSTGTPSLERTVVQQNIPSIVNNQTRTGSISLGKSFILLSTQVNTDTRIRLYGSQSYLQNDLTRPIGTDPTDNSGLIMDLILSGSPALYNYTLSPIVNGANMDPTVSSTIYYTVTNLSGVTTDISMSFNRIILE